MNYFNYLSDAAVQTLFFRPPGAFSAQSPQELLRYAVGGLLYIPASDQRIAHIISTKKVRGMTSVAICLEDSVGDSVRAACVDNLAGQLARLSAALESQDLTPEQLPLFFIRVKDVQMLEELAELFIRHASLVTGVILPKTTGETLERGLSLAAGITAKTGRSFYAMPILESQELMCCANRIALLQTLQEITDRYRSLVLNIRVGATDLSGLYGIRRGADTPLYSIGPVAMCIADIVRVFAFRDRYTVSGPVWEYFGDPEGPETAGLLREISLDLQNGILGKTCVHPKQLLPIQASYVVPYEVFQDAERVIGADLDCFGVLPSQAHNKMNELKPHALWAEKILRRAEIYGVRRPGVDRNAFMQACGEGVRL